MALIETHRPVKSVSLTLFALRALRSMFRRTPPEQIIAAQSRRAQARRSVDRLL